MKAFSTKLGLPRTTRKAVLRTSWGRLGGCFGFLGTSWLCFGCVLGGTWALLGGSAMRLRSLLERLGAAWDMSWARIGKNNKKDARVIIKMTPLGNPTWRPKPSKFDKINICFQRHFPTQCLKIFNGFVDQKINVFCNLSIRMQKYRF